MKNHSLIKTLIHLKGNPRGCVYTEPLWGIPYNLYIPYFSIFMVALGVTDRQIGWIASLGMLSQVVFSLLGGVITDKLGRRWTTLIFDIIAWGVPVLIWMVSQNFVYFAVAAAINGVYRVTANSWTCLLVEDSDKDKIVDIFTWVYISGLGASMFAPITGLFIKNFDLIPTMRVIFGITFVLMMTKFIVLFFISTETSTGKIKLHETKHVSLGRLLHGYGGIIKHILKTPATLFTLLLMIVMNIVGIVNGNFWGIIVTEQINIPEEFVGLFPFIKSAIMLVFFFFIIPRVNVNQFKKPLIVGLFILICSESLLIFTPPQGIIVLVVSVMLEACSISLISPLLDAMQVVLVDVAERARVIAILFVCVLVFSAPFGWIAGELSTWDRRLPFVMNAVLLCLGLILTLIYAKNTVEKAS